MKRIFYILVLVLVVVFPSCNGRVIYSEQMDIEGNAWGMTPYTFDVNVDNVDTTVAYDFLVTMRHDETFPNQNMWFFVDSEDENGNKCCDTLQCFVVDNYGHWVGNGIGSFHNISVYYKEAYKFPHRGSYRYTVRHGMRYAALQGVTNVGLRIEEHKEKQ